MKNARKSGKTAETEKAAAKEAAPMDATIVEHAVGSAPANNQRVCWALKTLVTEVHAMFAEAPVEYSNYDGRNTALDATFDLTVLDTDDRETLASLLGLVADDIRVKEVICADDACLVSMHPSARTKDDRTPFRVRDIFSILTDGDLDNEGDSSAQGEPEVWEGGDAFHTSSHVVDAGGAFG